MWNMPQRQEAWVLIHHIQFPTGAGLFTFIPFSRIKSSVSLSCFCIGQTPYTLVPSAGESPQEEELGDAGPGVGKL